MWEASPTYDEFDLLQRPELRQFADADPDLADNPRFRTTAELQELILVDKHGVKIYKVNVLHTATNKQCNPHYVILSEKLDGRDTYREFVCTYSFAVRRGVPCRHFWAVVRGSTSAAIQNLKFEITHLENYVVW